MTPHKHAAVIKAWADGSQLQYRLICDTDSFWMDLETNPPWGSEHFEFRIKPEVKTYDINVEWGDRIGCPVQTQNAKNLRLTFTDGKLTAAEVIA